MLKYWIVVFHCLSWFVIKTKIILLVFNCHSSSWRKNFERRTSALDVAASYRNVQDSLGCSGVSSSHLAYHRNYGIWNWSITTRSDWKFPHLNWKHGKHRMKWKRDLIEMRRERLAMPRLQAMTNLNHSWCMDVFSCKKKCHVGKTMIQQQIAIFLHVNRQNDNHYDHPRNFALTYDETRTFDGIPK